MNVTITINSRLEVEGLAGDLEKILIAENSFPNPKLATLERLGKWTGDEPASIDLWSRHKDRLFLPRGYFPTLLAKLKPTSCQVYFVDRTKCPPLTEPIEPRGSLYSYQETALEALLRYRTGLLEAPVGSGKTNILLTAISRLKTSALTLVHTTELMNQTCDRVRSWLGIEPGVIGGGAMTLAPVTVGMIQTLARRDLQAEGISEYFGAVFVDEAHHSPAMTWAAILEQLPSRYRYGLTATGWRKDGLQPVLWRLIGNRSAKISRAEVEAAGRMVWPKVETVQTDYHYPISDGSEWGNMITNLAEDAGRNQIIEREIRKRVGNDTRALVLSDRIEHCNILARMCADLDPIILTGEASKTEREAAMAKVRNGARLTIATTSLLGEGIDVPGWDLLFLVSPIAGGPRTIQAVGRVARPAPGKDRATVVDFVDGRVGMLVNAFKSRARLYSGEAA